MIDALACKYISNLKISNDDLLLPDCYVFQTVSGRGAIYLTVVAAAFPRCASSMHAMQASYMHAG